MVEKTPIFIDGQTVTTDDIFRLSTGKHTVQITEDAWERIRACRKTVDTLLATETPIYGLNTGLGNFQNVYLQPEQLHDLQLNLIRSHSVGCGEPLTLERTRMLFVARLNVFAKGHSGIREETVRRMIDLFNADCISLVPQQGTVGASGDLAPLAHLALGLLGEGEMWDVTTGKLGQAADIIKRAGLPILDLQPKEGLAMINGTQLMSSLGAESVERAKRVALQADIVAALTVEALRGNHVCFDSCLHAARNHEGQQRVAARMRALLCSNPGQDHTEIFNKHDHAVQDAYTLRCIPQVHGVCRDTINFSAGIINTELNSATDNPMVFADSGRMISGGNFHGEYPAKASDFLAIGVHEIAQMSERRVERLINAHLSGPSLADPKQSSYTLPSFLVHEGGLNSGFMMIQCTAAALVSENKVLVHPAASDSISTSCAQEDHVSMGGWAARKCHNVLSNVENCIAIELISAMQALWFVKEKTGDLKTSPALEAVYNLVRESGIPPVLKDRFFAPDIKIACELIRDGKLLEAVLPHVKAEEFQL